MLPDMKKLALAVFMLLLTPFLPRSNDRRSGGDYIFP
jgi:hypothetical protein